MATQWHTTHGTERSERDAVAASADPPRAEAQPTEYGHWTAPTATSVRWCALAALFAVFCACSGVAGAYAAIVGNLAVSRLLIVLSLTAPAAYLAGRAAIRIPRSGVSISSDAVTIVSPWLTRRVMLDDAAAFAVENRGGIRHPEPMITLRRKHHVLDVAIWALSRGALRSSTKSAIAALEPTTAELNAALERARRTAAESGTDANVSPAPPATRGATATFVAVLILSAGCVVGWLATKSEGRRHYFLYPWHTAAAFFATVGICVTLVLIIAFWLMSRARLRRRHVAGPPRDPGDSRLALASPSSDGVEPPGPRSATITNPDFRDPFATT